MLSLQTVLPDTLELLKRLMHQPLLGEMRLVGGTSLALQYGHRRSVDLDFFGTTTEDVEELTDIIHQCSNEVVRGHCTKRIKVYFLDGVKVDVVNYDYKWIDEPVIEDGLRLASPKDIAAMKVNAVMGRGTKKDFIDMYFLLQHYTFEDIIQFYLQKYPDGSEYRALLSMTYFADADPQPMPFMFVPVDWNVIKNEIRYQVEQYNKNNTL
jgi:predicted nucleotidyltransferase component of viral defense system